MLLGSKRHTENATTRWRLDYSQWLENTATILSATVATSSITASVGPSTILGKEVVFLLSGGTLNDRFMVSVVMTDSLGNIKPDTISFTVVAA